MMFNTRKNYTVFVKKNKNKNEVDSAVLCVITLYYPGTGEREGLGGLYPLPYPMGKGGGAK